MNMSRNRIIGIIIIIIGLNIVLNGIGLAIGAGLIGALFFLILSYVFYQKKKRLPALIFIFLALITLFNSVFNFNVGPLFVAFIFLFIGYRLIKSPKNRNYEDRAGTFDTKTEYKQRKRGMKRAYKKYKREGRQEDDRASDNHHESHDWLDEEIEALKKEKTEHTRPKAELVQENKARSGSYYKEIEKPDGPGTRPKPVNTPHIRSSLLGDLHLLNRRFELEDMNIWHGIGDVKIDLSKAIIPNGETVIVISGWLGDIDIYVPYDLDVMVNATVTLGDLDVLDYKQGGLNRQISVATRDYHDSPRRVKIMLSLFMGDIDVRYL